MKRILLFEIFVLSFFFSYSKTWSADASISSYQKIVGNSSVASNVVVTVKAGATLEIVGDFTLNGVVVLEEGAELKVSGTMNMDGRYGKNGYKKLNSKGNIIIGGDLKTGNQNYSNNVEIVLADMTVGGNVQIRTNTTVQIPSGKRVFVNGDFTNQGTVNCNGRLVVGTLVEDANGNPVGTSHGMISNYGTFNIETPSAALAKAKSDDPSLLENSVYYAAITCYDDFVLGNSSVWNPNITNGLVNMYDGSLVVHNNLDMWYCSEIRFKRGTSYVDVENDLTQYDRTYEVKGEEASVKLDGVGAKAVITVRETYDDWTSLDNDRATHDWDLDNNQFTIDPNVTLSVGKYDSRLTEYLDENTYSADDWGRAIARQSITKAVYGTDYDYMDDEIADNNGEINRLQQELLDYTGPNGEKYLELIEAYGSGSGKTSGETMAKQMRDQIQKDITDLTSLNATLGLIEDFGENKLTVAQIKTLNTWFYNTDFGKNLINQGLYIKSGGKYYTYKDYFYTQFNNAKDGQKLANNHLKLYHYILAYMLEEGYDKMYYDERHEALIVMLPIELSYFEVSQEGYSISFEWMTESEHNNDYFTVEYSLDGIQFYTIETVDGVGTSSEQHWYNTSTEADQFDGFVYFRLKQTDFNGEFSYSEVKALNVQSSGSNFTIYPNPASKYITIDGGAFTSVYFVDMQSRTYSAVPMEENMFSVENLSSGLYFAVISTAKGTVVKEFVVSSNSDWED